MSSSAFPSPNSPEYVDRGVLDRVPENVSFLAPSPETAIPLSTIGFKWHPRSQHLSIENFQPPSYYEDYIMTATYSAKMQEHQRSQAERLCKVHQGKNGPRSFVEIGCGDGSFMKYMRPGVPRLLGIEPSRRFADEAVNSGFEVIVGYVGSSTSLTEEKFDSFASRQVFEHLPDPVDVLIGIRKMLNAGAVGLIEVPNGQRALRLKRFFEFFPDHVNYYSVNSLVALASEAGFNVISCEESFNSDYLELWLRNEPDTEQWFQELIKDRESVCSELAKKISALIGLGKKVAIWGCGAKTLSILAACPPELGSKIAAIIDSDPHKHGRYVPNTAIQVISPSQAKALEADTIFILALSYREEIAASIRKDLGPEKQIYTIDNDAQVVEL